MDMNTDRIFDAEAAVIGSVLISPEIIGDVMLRVMQDDFLHPEYRHLYQAIHALWMQRKPVDAVTVLAEAGDAYRDLIRQAMAVTPTAANWTAYADILVEQTRLARLKECAAEIIGAASLDDARAAMSVADKLLCSRRDARIVTFAQGVRDFLERQTAKEPPKYFPWGIRRLDEHLYAEAGDMIVIGGAPSSGKTLLASQFAYHMALRGLHVGIFSLETSGRKLYDRLMSQAANVPFEAIKRYAIRQQDLEAVENLKSVADKIRYDVIDASGFSVADVQSVALAERYDVIFVDYLQLLQAKGMSRVEDVTNISIALHTMARRTGITVVALSQLSRPDKTARGRAPTMSDLRESGQIEQDADAIMLLKLAKDEDRNGDRILTIAKNKEGECGVIRLGFDALHLSMRPVTTRVDQKYYDRHDGYDGPDDDDDFPRQRPWPVKAGAR